MIRKLSTPFRSPIKFAQESWFYFRVGQTYTGFPLGFLGNMAAIYELVLIHLPFFAALHFTGFLLTAGPTYVAVNIFFGEVHMRTQAFVDSRVSAPQNPYVYKMFPYGVSAYQGMQMGRMQTEYTIKFQELEKEKWKIFQQIAPEIINREQLESIIKLIDQYIRENKKNLEMYDVLMRGGELGRKPYDFNRSKEYQDPYET